jgi:uncharacterized protein YgiM (DUF1202 family)
MFRANLEPKYAKVKIHSRSKPETERMKAQVQKLRIKNEIKFIYAKNHPNKTLYTLHLTNANKWGNVKQYTQKFQG